MSKGDSSTYLGIECCVTTMSKIMQVSSVNQNRSERVVAQENSSNNFLQKDISLKSSCLRKGLFVVLTGVLLGLASYVIFQMNKILRKPKSPLESSKVDISIPEQACRKEIPPLTPINPLNKFVQLFSFDDGNPLQFAMCKTLQLDKKKVSLEEAVQYFETDLRSRLSYPVLSLDFDLEYKKLLLADAKEYLWHSYFFPEEAFAKLSEVTEQSVCRENQIVVNRAPQKNSEK